jgi:hypothetical protein
VPHDLDFYLDRHQDSDWNRYRTHHEHHERPDLSKAAPIVPVESIFNGGFRQITDVEEKDTEKHSKWLYFGDTICEDLIGNPSLMDRARYKSFSLLDLDLMDPNDSAYGSQNDITAPLTKLKPRSCIKATEQIKAMKF